MNKISFLMSKYQPQLLKLANHPLGRKYLGISHEVKDKIVKLDPNAYTTQVGRRKFQSTFRCYNLFEKKLGMALKFSDSLLEGIKYYFTPKEMTWLEFEVSGDPIYASSGDGVIAHNGGGMSWSTAMASANFVNYTTDDGTYGIIAKGTNGTYGYIGNSMYPFDTATIPNGSVFTPGGSTVNLYSPYDVYDYWSADAKSRMDIVQTTQASLTQIATSDWAGIGTTLGATSIDLGSIVKSQYNAWTLNATGLTWIGTTFKVACREGHMTDNSEPGAASGETRYSGFISSFSKASGTTQDPKLVVTYTLPSFLVMF